MRFADHRPVSPGPVCWRLRRAYAAASDPLEEVVEGADRAAEEGARAGKQLRSLIKPFVQELNKGLARPEVREKIALQGMDATPSASPAAFEQEVKAETPYWENLVRDSGAKVE